MREVGLAVAEGISGQEEINIETLMVRGTGGELVL